MAEVLRPTQSELRRHDFKTRGPLRDQEQRRAQLLDRQRQARRDLTDYARRLAAEAFHQDENEDTAEDDAINGAGAVVGDNMEVASDLSERPQTHSHRRPRVSNEPADKERPSSELTVPEWMIDIPSDLSTQWLAVPRPEGRRVVVISARGRTVSRTLRGSLHKAFRSALPNGGPSSCGQDTYSIVDCIFQNSTQTFYVLDVMCWKGYSLYDCDAEFRFFWAQSKFGETRCEELGRHNEFRFVLLPRVPCLPTTLPSLHTGACSPAGMLMDGLLFYHKAAHYHLGPTPLVLLWKDAQCSPYFPPQHHDGDPQHQVVLLQVAATAALCTADDPPLVLASLHTASSDMPPQHAHSPPRPGDVVRCTISQALYDDAPQHAMTDSASPAVRVLQVRGLVTRSRNQPAAQADLWSKILFLSNARLRLPCSDFSAVLASAVPRTPSTVPLDADVEM